ncbi:putative RNA-binding protein Luc7-like 2 isoform X1 [Fopius arisanus]|uniref:LUC7L2_1 protein n=2 Tax=Fopius arisanus TaxID=64838 RepID=A0A0C9R370_9HYME|nr:PREDICTED: putative RNA-binding protein Luc7-like 2 isoform X1 [Fopius arisanus]XP_011302763.1 PREDICTED: putative RNA-binding protein Luc7-like 2 isoform X1 [Fopius arisanus]XP_011302764.1 PREDICTED: putative RNA-binding protein Luc7-like 2 isoform X1 [Fopius arisanus]XP_011302765.1 PREDICTED: putative RNA-binding protein Luc7-like 2 isoform X1 [Fopius arisanus]XP_011302766.1 PREDICTED: putative RNA-binding protein Luc7-like 2 isoform X1 [Fopius arisanus]
MTAHDQMRAMLDQLMGTGRNGENNKFQVKYSDPKVCKSFLLACCPHEILSSTRMDLGECPQIHDLALRADYEAAQKKKDHFYDIDAMEHLQNFIADCDRRTEQAKQRLAETQEELSAEVAAKANSVHVLAEEIGKKLAKAEQLGEEGFVEESMKLMGEIDELRKRKNEAEQEYRNSMPASSYQQQKLRVCEVCSAYLGIHDNDRRLADHFGGKLHLGFIKIREKLADLENTVEERRKEKRESMMDRDRHRDRDDRDRRDSRDRGRGLGYRERERERDRDRERRDRDRRRSRSRSRSRGKRSRRSRSNSRSRRSRSRRSGSNDRKR